jgi:signal transduction histidine kinase
MKVSCRAMADGMEVMRERGILGSELVEGLNVSAATLADRNGWIEWDELTIVMDRIADRLGGLEAYRDMIASFAEHPRTHHIRRFLGLALTPERTYHVVFSWLGPSIYPCHTTALRSLGPGKLEIVLEIDPKRRGSLPFLHGAVGTATTLPRLHGLPDALVESEITSHHARLVVQLPATVSLVGRARRWVQAVTDAPAVVEELIRQQNALQQRNDELQLSYERARSREAQLAAEMKAREDAQAELARRNQELLHAQRMESVGRLAGGVAHDFNNLLTAILGQTEILMDEAKSPEARDALGEIQAAAERAAAVTSQLLAFGRKQPSKPARVDLNAMLRDLDGLLRRLLGDIDVRTHYTGSPAIVFVDRIKLEQVVVNLAVNGRDAMPNGGMLTIRTEDAEHGQARLVVEDDGVGMPAEVRDRVFEAFFTTKGDHGTGLGLASAREIITEAGGDIAVDSQLGHGTRFTIVLPTVEGEADARPSRRSPAPEEERRGTILVIEDEPAIRRLVARALRRAGHEVLSARDRESALDAAEGRELHVVISDVMLGGDRGPQIVSQLQTRHPDAGVIFMSGYAEWDAVDLPSDAPLLLKPFELADLETKVQQMLARRVERLVV